MKVADAEGLKSSLEEAFGPVGISCFAGLNVDGASVNIGIHRG